MALPKSELVLKAINPDELTLDELCLFEPSGFTATGFRAFLIARTNWTRAEVGRLTMRDLKAIAEKLAEKINEAAVPNAN